MSDPAPSSSALTEFPDFDGPVWNIPPFEDTSWHNDVCPSYTCVDDFYVLTFWTDYVDKARRELPISWSPQFSLTRALVDQPETVTTLVVADSAEEFRATLLSRYKDASGIDLDVGIPLGELMHRVGTEL